MIERKFVAQKLKEYSIQEYIRNTLRNVGHSHTKVQNTPLGEKIIIYASRPGLIVGRKGQNIKNLTKALKERFGLENPQIEISEVTDVNLDPINIAERIVSSLERYGTARFKGVGHKVMASVLASGALGIEILISGKIPSARARTWRFYQDYLKTCGDAAIEGVRKAHAVAKLKTGIIGVKVSIMPKDIVLPDTITLVKEKIEEFAQGDAPPEESKGEQGQVKKKRVTKKKTVKKKAIRKGAKKPSATVEQAEHEQSDA